MKLLNIPQLAKSWREFLAVASYNFSSLAHLQLCRKQQLLLELGQG